MNFRHIAIGLLVTLVLGCPWDDDDDKKDRTRAEFCNDWAAAACSKEVVSACQAESAEDCQSTQEDACRELVPEDFSDEMGQDCIKAVKAAYEDADLQGGELATVLRLGGKCDKLIAGNKDAGDECNSNSDCDRPGGYECVRHSDDDKGTCQIPTVTGAGRDCSAAQRTCEVGFYCDGDNCIEAKDTGDECTIQEECGEGAFCSGSGKCESKHDVGADCTDDIECDDGICYEFEGAKTCTDRIRLGRSEPLCEALK